MHLQCRFEKIIALLQLEGIHLKNSMVVVYGTVLPILYICYMLLNYLRDDSISRYVVF